MASWDCGCVSVGEFEQCKRIGSSIFLFIISFSRFAFHSLYKTLSVGTQIERINKMGKKKLVRRMVRGWVRWKLVTSDNASLSGVPSRIVKSAKTYITGIGIDPGPTFIRLRGLLKIGG